MVPKNVPVPQLDLDAFQSAATRELHSQLGQLDVALDELDRMARETATVMTKSDLTKLLFTEYGKDFSAAAGKGALIDVYAAARVEGSSAKKMLDGLERAARADRRAAEKLNELARADRALEDALVKAIDEHGLRSCLRNTRILDLPAEQNAAIHARHIIKLLQGGQEIREVLAEQFEEIFATLAGYPSKIRVSGVSPSASSVGAHGEAEGAAEFIRAIALAYANDFTMTIPLACMQ